MDDQVAGFKQGQRAVWSAGNFDAMAEHIWGVGARVVEATSVAPGDDVLDVGCGTGNAATRAAKAGGKVTGLDLTPELFDDARRHAAEEGVELELIEGDAEDLPFGDESFDVVLSTFGCMFAPRHDVAAAQIARVVRPGGRIGITAWTPEGKIGGFFKMVSSHMPPPTPGVATGPPLLWGTEDHLTGLFSGSGIELSFDRDFVTHRFDTIDLMVDFYLENFGPLVMARAALEPQGKWDALVEDLRALFTDQNEADDGTLLVRSEYLLTTGVRT